MTVQRMDHVGIVVDDLDAAKAFFVELGLEQEGEASVEGEQVDSIVGLEGVRSDIVMMQTPDGHGRLELIKFQAPSGPSGDRHVPANAPGLRHITFAVDDLEAVITRCKRTAQSSWWRGELRRQLPALLHPRPGGNHRRAGGEDRPRKQS